MVVRAARCHDAPAMARVIVDTFLSAHQGQLPEAALARRRREWTYEVSEQIWTRELNDVASGDKPLDCAYVAEDEDGTVVGLATGGPAGTDLTGNTGALHTLFIRESHQRRGLGRQLLLAVATELAKMGMTALVVHCWAANAPARRFYEALDGRVIREREVVEFGEMAPEVLYHWPDIRSLVDAGYHAGEAETRERRQRGSSLGADLCAAPCVRTEKAHTEREPAA